MKKKYPQIYHRNMDKLARLGIVYIVVHLHLRVKEEIFGPKYSRNIII